jgi:hypothetical protein
MRFRFSYLDGPDQVIECPEPKLPVYEGSRKPARYVPNPAFVALRRKVMYRLGL